MTACTETQACCLAEEACADLDPLVCDLYGGHVRGSGTACTEPVRCCTVTGECLQLDPVCCLHIGGTPYPTEPSCPAVECCATGTRLYWANGAGVVHTDTDGANFEYLPLYQPTSVSAVAPDHPAGKLYWGTSSVYRSDLDGTNIEFLVPGGGGPIQAIVLAPSMGQMYWADSRLRRANLDGTGFEDVYVPVLSPSGHAFDAAEHNIYFADVGGGRIYRARPDGSELEAVIITGLGGQSPLAIDASARKMYWCPSSGASVRRSNLDGSGVESLALGGAFVWGLALDPDGEKIYWTESNKIRRANLDGTGIEEIVAGLTSAWGIAVDAVGGKVYWTERGYVSPARIARANLDGSNVETLASSGLQSPHGIALDLAAGKIYWTNHQYPNSKIERANLNGTQRTPFLVLSSQLLTHLTLDSATGTLFWTGNWQIHRTALDLALNQEIIRPGSVDGVALDVDRGHTYWTDAEQGKIRRANLDGFGVFVLRSTPGELADIAVDPTAGWMYWIESQSIRRADLAGVGMQTVVGFEATEDLALDVPAGRLYWTNTDSQEIRSARVDGSDVRTAVPDAWGGPRDLALAGDSCLAAQACCSDGAACQMRHPTTCANSGRTPQGVGTACDGDVDGDAVDAACGDPCPDDPADDSDGDGVCDSNDVCAGMDDTIDADHNGVADCLEGIPTVSGWGVIVLTLALLSGAKISFSRRRALRV